MSVIWWHFTYGWMLKIFKAPFWNSVPSNYIWFSSYFCHFLFSSFVSFFFSYINVFVSVCAAFYCATICTLRTWTSKLPFLVKRWRSSDKEKSCRTYFKLFSSLKTHTHRTANTISVIIYCKQTIEADVLNRSRKQQFSSPENEWFA